jgi:hypothetical protein
MQDEVLPSNLENRMAWLFSTGAGRLVLAAVGVLWGSFLLACAGQAGVGCLGIFLAMGLTIASLGWGERTRPRPSWRG